MPGKTAGESYMKKLLHKFKGIYNKIDMESAGISLSAGFLSQEGKIKGHEEGVQGAGENVFGEIKVGFICNAGFGSSAMGATLFRKKLLELGIDGVDVKAYPADQVPKDLAVAVCQRDFREMTGIELRADKVCIVENLLAQAEYTQIAGYVLGLKAANNQKWKEEG